MKKAKRPNRRGTAASSEAVQPAVRESPPSMDFKSLLGIGMRVPMNPNPKFKNEDDLWKKDRDGFSQ